MTVRQRIPYPYLLGLMTVVLFMQTAMPASRYLDSLTDRNTATGTILQPDFLAAEHAFVVNAMLQDKQHLQVTWQMPEGYYLYRHSLHLTSGNAELDSLALPPGLPQYDEDLGHFEIYLHAVTASAAIIAVDNTPLNVTVSYQGCAANGYCYPPMQKTFSFDPAKTEASPLQPTVTHLEEPTPLAEHDRISQLLAEQNTAINLAAFFGFGLLLAFTPCVLPMLPILSSIILGQTDAPSGRRSFMLASSYVLALALTYAVAGAFAGLAGSGLQNAFQKPWLLSLVALLLVLLALSMFGFYEIRLPHKLQNYVNSLNSQQQGGRLISVFFMGILSALVVSPCVTAPLVGALAYIGHTGDALFGGIALFSLGLGMGTPLILVMTLGAEVLPTRGYWMHAIKNLLGVLLLALAISLLSRFLPGPISLFLWGSLSISTAVFLGALRRPKRGIAEFWQSIGIILLILGGCYVVGAALGNSDLLRPLTLRAQPHESTSRPLTTHNSQIVKTVSELNEQLQLAQQQQRPVMVEFRADWCLSCLIMERNVLSNDEVKSLLHTMRVLVADVTQNDQEDKALMHYLNVFAPPTFLFYDASGKELQHLRIVAETSKAAFLTTLEAINL